MPCIRRYMKITANILKMYNDVTRLESHVYFYGLRKERKLILKLAKEKSFSIKYLEQSDRMKWNPNIKFSGKWFYSYW